MGQFNPLDYPLCLETPRRLAESAWLGHIPFGMFLIDALRPRLVVELGTLRGVSYCAFCQSVQSLQLDTRCYAIDTWCGDEHCGTYEPEVLTELRAYHDPLYGSFSRLIQNDFNESLNDFEDSSIDLLHIDGFHTYEAVKSDFESWLPKMSARGVVVLHDINVRERGFGVWKLWEEIRFLYPNFAFFHDHGLGVVEVGRKQNDQLHSLFMASEGEAISLRRFFQTQGERIKMRFSLKKEQALMAEMTACHHAMTTYQHALASKESLLQEIYDLRIWRLYSRYGRLKRKLMRGPVLSSP